MKKQILTSIAMMVSALTLNSTAFASEDCASGLTQLEATPTLKSLLQEFGGIDQLTGYWKLGGLAGSIQPTTIKVMASANQFSDQVAEKANGKMQLDAVDIDRLCVNSSEPDVLYVRPVKAIDPANALIKIKPVDQGSSISLKNATNGYHQFNSASGFPPLGK